VFSGIIEAIGQVRRCSDNSGGKTLVVAAGDYWTDVGDGASIAIDGVCLTVTSADHDSATFDVVAETLRRTTLGDLRPGGRVNLQKSLAIGDRIDGHFVQGHVDAVGTVEKAEQSPRESKWWFSLNAEARAYIIPKGSVAIDGISLTVADVEDGLFSVALIPTTLQQTTIGQKRPGARVNIETDILARTVVNYLQSIDRHGKAGVGSVSRGMLERHGFA
jgi:riboflavin synthase